MAETPAKRRKVDSQRQAPNNLSFEDFAPGGDVVFIVKGKTRVRVYSDVMKRASLVFAAMLGPNFKEGRALAEASTTPVEIALPEDNPGPFGWICRALHCQASTKLWKPVTAQLLSVWMLIDKYDMKDGMQLSLGFWIREQFNGERPREISNYELWLLAQISLGVQDAGSFTLVTRKLIRENTKASFVRMATISEPAIPIIPGRLLYKLAGMAHHS
ncbi:uncharacterized protein B0J16DRAFT_406195 [Fusarium flagelliforme]|uniref:uncharacterized protein n=1 Tax=Fusarium flagelliforme TaxID=2675880 RepID=UPI001E8D010A|nr:uncharacterized protein B0J16DRAFT_406195 [Fusarium flagelliforme]KAH7173823.1 hypothetical protein B0J16DRAFT_406195 [Fusarium flagelliforme]